MKHFKLLSQWTVQVFASAFIMTSGFLLNYSVSAQELLVTPTNFVCTSTQWVDCARETYSVQITNATSSHMFWFNATSTWVTVSPSNGMNAGETDTGSLVFATANLSPGTYFTTITAISPLTTNVMVPMDIELTVNANPDVLNGIRVRPNVFDNIYTSIVNTAVEIPIELIAATDNVCGISFSLNFDKKNFSKPSVEVLHDASFVTNTTKVNFGQLGVTILAPVAYPVGTTTIAIVSFQANPKMMPGPAAFGFGVLPTCQQLADTNASIMSGISWPNGMVFMTSGIEGNLYPRTTNGPATISLADVSQIGRFSANLDLTTSPGEFQRADCAPRGIFGDGLITVADWVQAGLYYAAAKVDVLGSGPAFRYSGTIPTVNMSRSEAMLSAVDETAKSVTLLQAENIVLTRGSIGSIKVLLNANGLENAVGFSLDFDPSALVYQDVVPDAAAGMFLMNNAKVAQGKLGLAFIKSPGTQFSEGIHELAEVFFMTTAEGPSLKTAVKFADSPLRTECVNIKAKNISMNTRNADNVVILPLDWDPTKATVTVTSPTSDPLTSAPVPVTIRFNKTMESFDVSDLALVNARAEGFSGNLSEYSFYLYPRHRGKISVCVPADVARDVLGTGNVASPVLVRSFGAVEGDLDMDGAGDLALYNAANGQWYVLSINGTVLAWGESWGGPGMMAVPGDYDGDTAMDQAVYQESTGSWFIKGIDGRIVLWGESWGGPGMTAVPGDYDGDLKSDLAVYGDGSWFIRTVAGSVLLWNHSWGGPEFKAVSGDFNGDFVSDLATFYDPLGTWFIKSITGESIAYNDAWGAAGYVTVSGDFNGDGCSDQAVYDPASGTWFIKSVTGEILAWAMLWGGEGFTPLALDCNADGAAELIAYQESTGCWFATTLSGTIVMWGFNWGGPGLLPAAQ